ncbi:ribonuclease T2 isoform X2 [Papio anubis]|uniref:ribonuclease T2 isoform X2 n=1 Tax=Papio anubis TaxID=9555 RepID=UPI000B7B7A84|nr:ribonuclease T2 isoform X2 [Papio anubis]
MRPAALRGALLGCLYLALLCLGGADKRLRDNHEWKKLIMVQHWPETVCEKIQNDCRDPPDYWTIHGLWPDKSEGCNRSWPFNLEEIKDLLPEMKAYWPDVIHSFPNRSRFCVLLKLGIKPSINYYQVADFKDALARVYGVIPKIQCLPPSQDEEVQTVGQIELCLTKQDQQLQNCTEPGEQPSPKQEAWLADGETESRGLRVCEDGPVFYPPPKKIKH